ncbi:MAG: hypothetical protein IKS90_07120 [Clostridia bacterium]|nr:hypothetical protein [Clostridia bacterium]
MKSVKSLLCAAILLAFAAIAAFGCTGTGISETTDPTNVPSTIAYPDGTYCFDRTNIDLSGYSMPERGVLIGTEEYNSAVAEPNQVLLKCRSSRFIVDECKAEYDIDEYEWDIYDYPVYRFAFTSIKQSDQTGENCFFEGCRVSFLHLRDYSLNGFPDLGYSRNVTDSSDFAFVFRNLAQNRYRAYTKGECIDDILGQPHIKLFCFIENDYGIRDTYIIGKDLRVMHTTKDVDSILKESPESIYNLTSDDDIEDISIEPIDEEVFLHLLAMNIHYLRAECNRASIRSPLGLNALPKLDDYSSVIRVEAEYGGRKINIEGKDDVDYLIDVFGVDFADRDFPAVRLADQEHTDDAESIKFTVFVADAGAIYDQFENGYVLNSFSVTPDGRIWYAPNGDYSGFVPTGSADEFVISAKVNNGYRLEQTCPYAELMAKLGF